MTDEELLEEAKRRYPKGTKYISAHKFAGSHINTVDLLNYRSLDTNIMAESGKGYIYYDGKWATIIFSPIPESFEIDIFN